MLGGLLWPKSGWVVTQQPPDTAPAEDVHSDVSSIVRRDSTTVPPAAADTVPSMRQSTTKRSPQPHASASPPQEVVHIASALGRIAPFYRGLLESDAYCSDFSRGAFMRCVHETGVMCARQTICPAKALEHPLPVVNVTPGGLSLLEVRAHRTQGTQSSGGSVHHLVRGDEFEPLDEGTTSALVMHTFCRFRDAFIKWNATAHRMSALCKAADDVDVNPTWQTAGEVSLKRECQRWVWFLGNETQKVVHHSATNNELAAAGGSTLDVTYAGEDVTALAHALAQIPSTPTQPQSDAREALLTVLLRTTRGAGHQTLVDELNVADVAMRAAAMVSEDAKGAKEAAVQYGRWHERGIINHEDQAALKVGHLGEVAIMAVRQPDWGCHKAEYPLVRVAVVGETIQGSWYHRVQRFVDSMCTYCRNTPFLVKLQPFLQSAASIQTGEGESEQFRRSRSYRESLQWSPDIVVFNLGLMDAKLGGVDIESISVELWKMISAYKDLPSRPEVMVVLPHQAFDVETEAGRRHTRTKRLLVGPVARRLYDVVIPGIVGGARRGLREDTNEGIGHKVTLVDFHQIHLRWLRRMVHLAASPNASDASALGTFVPGRDDSAEEDALASFPVDAPAAQQILRRHLPDGVTSDKITQKLLGAVMFRALLQRF
ncbi:Hypothetical protein, putative [Bodo saltans]|uniref:Uncharacterized protein n=1 Tax=Bodo saltans TaxID=75058 RepID=A0A0S4IT69_BODSA|nr:Hypothetical protein, putative [Bodo saltans]|eukprot:CUG06443.1 Hypothetical protein, putative [Bodo saltans]